MNFFANYEEMAAMILFGIGFTTLLLDRNMIKKIIGFSMMDSGVYLFLAAKGYIEGRTAPIVVDGIHFHGILHQSYSCGSGLDRHRCQRQCFGADAGIDGPPIPPLSHAGH